MAKIYIIQDYLRLGGTERQSIHFAECLSQTGHAVTLLTFCRGGALEKEAQESPLFHCDSLRRKDGGAIWWARGLVKKLREESPNIVVLMGRNANHWGWWIKRKLPDLSVIATCRTGRRLWWCYRQTLRTADRVIVNSQFLAQQIASICPEARPMDVLYNGLVRDWDHVDLHHLRQQMRTTHGIAPSETLFLNVQMFRPGKRKVDILRLLEKLRDQENWHCWLVGEGEERPACEAWVEEKGLAERIRFFDTVADPVSFYAAGDVVLSTSQEESLPNQFVEAQWLGRYVICYDVAGSKECFLPGVTGAVHPVGDDPAFLQSMENCLRFSSSQYEEIAHRAQVFARENFHPKEQAKKLLQIIALTNLSD